MCTAPVIARRLIAGLMILVLALAGAGRGFASVPANGTGRVVIAGVTVALCETGKADRDGQVQHDCEMCALGATPLLPLPAGAALPAFRTRPASEAIRAEAVTAPYSSDRRPPPRGPPGL